MTSIKRIKANQQNGKKGKGPKTLRGKLAVSNNALKEGVFARELYITDEDRPTYTALEEGLRRQFNPQTAMQRLAFEVIPCCAWRYLLALRREKRQLQETNAGNAGNSLAAPPSAPTIVEWYARDLNALHAANRLLQQVKNELTTVGILTEPNQDALAKAFGPEFANAIKEWQSADAITLQMVHHFEGKAEVFGEEYPKKGDVDPTVKYVADPEQQLQMQIKLLDFQLAHLVDARHIIEGGVQDAAKQSAAEPAYRYVTAAFKELTQATEFYDRVVQGDM